MKRRGDKTQTQMKHAIRRARERFDVALYPHDLLGMVAKIQSGEFGFLRRQSHRISLWEVELPGEIMAQGVYDNQRKMIVTFLPLDWEPLHGEDLNYEEL